MDISIPTQVTDQVSDRCLRCYREQQWYGENFLFDFIGDTNVSGKRILEIGCAEAGLLKFYQNKGAYCSGLELSDTNVIRDVIEHIEDKITALANIFNLLKPGGKLFMSFPPKYCAYAGHQQTVPTLLGKLPYLHVLPNFIYKAYLNLISCPVNKINYLISTKETRISIRQMRNLIKSIGYHVKKESKWLVRPAYSFRFGLPKMKNPFSWIPGLDEVFSNGVLYLLERPEI